MTRKTAICPDAVVTSNLGTDDHYLEFYLRQLSHSMHEGICVLALEMKASVPGNLDRDVRGRKGA